VRLARCVAHTCGRDNPNAFPQAFSVRWRNLSPSETTCGYVYVDGVCAGGRFGRKDRVVTNVISDILVTPTISRSLMFSALELTGEHT
jgi:hypothetical protein